MAAAAALSVRTTTTSLLAAVLSLCIASLSHRGADAARVSPVVATCMTGPYPELCVCELGQRLLDVQTFIASAAPNQGAAKIAGAPRQVDVVKALVSVALEAAPEAGAVAVSVFKDKLQGFNTSVPDFHCLGNCTVTMRSAMQKLHGAPRPRCTRATHKHCHHCRQRVGVPPLPQGPNSGTPDESTTATREVRDER